jgi:dihydroxy-acid dehydratase
MPSTTRSAFCTPYQARPNAVLHLIAYAGRVGIDLPLRRFDELSASTPWLVNLKPSGERLMEDFYYAGGLPAVMAQITDLLHLDALTVSGRTVGEKIAGAEIVDRNVIATTAEPLQPHGSLVVLTGSLCPDGAVMKSRPRSRGFSSMKEGLSYSRTCTTWPPVSTIRTSTSTPIP